MYDHTFLNMQITRSDIRPHKKWAVSLVIAYGHLNLPHVGMYMPLGCSKVGQETGWSLIVTHGCHILIQL